MNPLKITLRNVRSFREAELAPEDGLLAILGANGAGKSTLINAIDVALFGPESRSLADWYPRDGGSEPLSLLLEFEHANGIYRVRRDYDPRGRGKATLDLDFYPEGSVSDAGWIPLTRESIAETQAWLEELIGLSRETFRASSFLAQGDAAAFCEAAPRQRKQILAEIVGLSDWDQWLEKARHGKRETQSQIDNLTGRLALYDTDLDTADPEPLLAETRERLTAARTHLEELAPRIVAAREQIADQKRIAQMRQVAAQRHATAHAAVTQAKQGIAQRKAEIAKISETLEEVETVRANAEVLPELEREQDRLIAMRGHVETRARLAEEQKRILQNIEEARRRIETIAEAEASPICDRCGQALADHKAEKAARDSQQQERDVYEERIAGWRSELVSVQDELDVTPKGRFDAERLAAVVAEIASARGAVARLEALTTMATRRAEAERELDPLGIALDLAEQDLADAQAGLKDAPKDPGTDLAAVELELQRLIDSEEVTRRLLDRTGREEAALLERKARLEKTAQERQETQTRLAALHDDLDVLLLLERACGPNGVPTLILETQAIPQIEAETNRLLAELGGPAFACELRTLREKKTGGLADTLDIVLLTATGPAPYESFSGGEKARIAFALRLALAELLASRSGSSTDLLIIDEIDGLDADGVAALVRVLEEMRSRIAKIIVVSHQAELRDAFERSIRLEQVDGYSRIVEEAIV